jgi:hypothetical protein
MREYNARGGRQSLATIDVAKPKAAGREPAPVQTKFASVLRMIFLFSGIAHDPESRAMGMQNIRGSSRSASNRQA